jgi:multiple sugar transport system ATP-binding protein
MVYVTHDQTEAMTLGDRVAVMRTGTIQQVGAPQELYENPINLFVAGFIGSPAMNFMPGKLENGKLHTRMGEVPLDDETRRLLEGSSAGRDVILGIRPESFEDAELVPAEAKDRGITFQAAIDVVESMGSDVFAYFTFEGEGDVVSSADLEELARDSGRADTGGSGDQVVARLDAATNVREGSDAELWADVRSIHVFDPESGQNITQSRAKAAAS